MVVQSILLQLALLLLQRAASVQHSGKEAGVSTPVAAESNVLAAYSKGSAASYKKLSQFFGEPPPRVEDLQSLCDELGYTHLLPVSITYRS